MSAPGGPHEPSDYALAIGTTVLPGGMVRLTLQVGPVITALVLGTADQAEQVAEGMREQILRAVADARRESNGLHLPGMPGFPLGQFPGAEPLPGFTGPPNLPPGHPDRAE